MFEACDLSNWQPYAYYSEIYICGISFLGELWDKNETSQKCHKIL